MRDLVQTDSSADIHDTGLFYVIDGFLDMILPTEKTSSDDTKANQKVKQNQQEKQQTKKPTPEYERSWSRSGHTGPGEPRDSRPSRSSKDNSQKPLFTVKPGGIAGYLCAFACTYVNYAT